MLQFTFHRVTDWFSGVDELLCSPSSFIMAIQSWISQLTGRTSCSEAHVTCSKNNFKIGCSKGSCLETNLCNFPEPICEHSTSRKMSLFVLSATRSSICVFSTKWWSRVWPYKVYFRLYHSFHIAQKARSFNLKCRSESNYLLLAVHTFPKHAASFDVTHVYFRV